jgi:molybdopterin-dependent oxidoreductase alpha subunit
MAMPEKSEPQDHKVTERHHRPRIRQYDAPAGGWGSVRSLARSLTREGNPTGATLELMRQNKPDGFACVSCAWAKPGKPHTFEFCEEGAKATTWEITSRRAPPEFFAAHRLTELESWADHDLEELGRLTHPMRWDAASDRYLPVSWQDAFAEIGAELKALRPNDAVFYTSGRASLETSYMYALMVRLYGTNNLPDSSNMCHESTSVALPESIGVGVGTVTLDDFPKCDGIFFFGQNVGTSSPRMLHDLQDASRRGVPIITFNPLRERGLVEFANPQSPADMLHPGGTRISEQYHQVKAGGDLAALVGMCKALIASEDEAVKGGKGPVLDHAFIADHTHGFAEFKQSLAGFDWADIQRRSGLSRAAIEAAAAVYARCERVIGIYGMGVTQHRHGVETVQMLVNLLLLRGNFGKEGAGICPVRGHSNVQGQRTVGISEKPELVPLDKLAQQYGFEPPRKKGLNTVEACEAIIAGKVRAFVSLGGNFVRAVPDRDVIEPAWRKLRLTVQIATKLNRSHLVHGEISYVLPCLGRIELDEQRTGSQAVTVEDSTGCIHGSLGLHPPASPHLLSEAAIVAGIAKSVLDGQRGPDWDAWVGDYALVRDAIAETYPDIFHDFNARMWQPGGFHRPIAPRERQWKTSTGKANFIEVDSLDEDPDVPHDGDDRGIFQLITLRSNDQFNTTIYGYNDRFRGIHGTRMVVLMNPNDIARLGFHDGEIVDLVTAIEDGRTRAVRGLRITAYDIPEGCLGGYYPECNPLVPLWHHAKRSKVPAAKSVPVRIVLSSKASDTLETSEHRVTEPLRFAARDVGAGAAVATAQIARAMRRDPRWPIGVGLLLGSALALWLTPRLRV